MLAKLISLTIIGTILIVAAIALIYKPIYKVTINGEKIGYCADKKALQKKINLYMEKGEDNDNENLAFVQIDELPEYELCLLKKGIVTNDEEIYNEVKENGVKYYRYYAILEEEKEQLYVASFNEAEEIISTLKTKESSNSDNLTILEHYETKIPEFTSKTNAVDSLYKEKKVAKVTPKSSAGSGKISTSRELSNKRINLGLNLAKPVSGILTSRYGYRWGRTHTGIDIGAHSGTPIKAAASGTVSFSGWKGSLGYLVVISHGNGIQTYYGHCSKLLVSAGEKVSTGQVIAKVGSTGRSTGAHLHFEIRVNGSSLNPLGYVNY